MADTLIREMGGSTPVTAAAGDRIPIDRGGTDAHTTVGSIADLAGGLPLQLPIQDGRYYGPSLLAPIDSEYFEWDSFDGLIVAVPGVFGEEKTWNRIGMNIGTGNAGAVARLGLYADNNGVPSGGSLIVDAGEIDASGTGELEKEISQSLAANVRHWRAALISGSVATAWGIAYDTSAAWGLASFLLGASGDATSFFFSYSAAQSYGALPSTFPAATPNFDGAPYIWLRTGV